MMTADAVRLTTTDLLQGRLGLAPLECSRCNRRAQPRTWEVAAMCRIALLTSIVALVLACTLELTSVAGAQEVKPRAVRPPKNAAQPAPKPPVGAASPEDCGTNSAIYWAGSGPKVHVIRQGTLTERKPLDPTSPLTQMVVLEVRILDKLAATYGPSFESMRRSGPPIRSRRKLEARSNGSATSPECRAVLASSRKMAPRSWRHSDLRAAAHVDRTSGVIRPETKTRGKGTIRSATRQPCRGAPFNDRSQISRWRPGHHGRSYAEAASRPEYGCHISASRFTRSLSGLWHASGRNWHPAEGRGKSFS